MSKKPKQTAVEAFAQKERELRELLGEYDRKLELFKREFVKQGGTGWSYAGSLGHDIELLKELHFLKDW